MIMASSRGRTSLLDAIYMGLQKMKSAQYGRKALLIISDGGDNHSRYTEKEIKAAVKEADVMIYAVGIYDNYVQTQEELLGPELLRNVTSLTGGHAYALTNPMQLPGAAKSIGSQLRHQYVLAYQPEPRVHDGKWHKVTVKLRVPKQLPIFHVEARPGYYAAEE
jgi:Ca-activated chloride channel homolog